MPTSIRTPRVCTLAAGLLASGLVYAQTPAAGGAYTYFISPAQGEHVSSPVTVRFGLAGMGVAPAGVMRDNTGHHHLIIDTESLPDLSSPLPADDRHRHFGNGQTEVKLELPSGTHTLRLILGDGEHRPHLPPVFSDLIRIHVK